jgi:hypothetical protein
MVAVAAWCVGILQVNITFRQVYKKCW